LMDIEPTAKFVTHPGSPPPKLKPPPPPPATPDQPSPKADDTLSQVQGRLPKSKTIWGGVIGYLTTAVTAIGGVIDKLGDNPYAWGFLGLVLTAGGIGLYLVIKGRIDVQKLIEHLSQDDKDGE
jgi:hypothetical protein